MKTIQSGGGRYDSPQVKIVEILPETVLCQSDKEIITGQTGSNWYVGEDAEW